MLSALSTYNELAKVAGLKVLRLFADGTAPAQKAAGGSGSRIWFTAERAEKFKSQVIKAVKALGKDGGNAAKIKDTSRVMGGKRAFSMERRPSRQHSKQPLKREVSNALGTV